MKSGPLLTVYPVASKALYKPPPAPGAFRKKFQVVAVVAQEVTMVAGAAAPLMVVTDEKPRPPIVACGPSIETPRANLPWKSFTARIAYCRAQVKPATYCGSIISGSASCLLAMPFLFSVAKVHIWPPVKDAPFSQAI